MLSLFGLSWKNALTAYALIQHAYRRPHYCLRPSVLDGLGLLSLKGCPPRWTSLENEVVASRVPSDGVSVIGVTVNCQQDACELLTEQTRGSKRSLGHPVIVDTSGERIWRPAITNLAQSIAAD